MIKPEVLDAMVAAGCTAEQIAAAVKADQAGSSGAARQARYRARKASQSDERNVTTVTVTAEVPPKKETSPTPPKEKTTPSITEPNGSSKTRAARLSADWVLPVEWRQDAIKAGLPQNRIDLEAEKMRDWSISSPNGAKREWRSAWRNWVKGAVDKLPRGSPGYQTKPKYDPFKAYAEELSHGQDRSERSDLSDWDDAQGVSVLTIEHHRR